MQIHCQNSDCKCWWEDSCTRSLEGKMVALDAYGHCMDFADGISDYYDHLDGGDEDDA